MKNKLENLKADILGELAKVSNGDLLRELEIKYLGRKGELSNILRAVKDLGEKEKQEIGQLANTIKSDVTAKFEEIKKGIASQENKDSFVDVTLPGKMIEAGHLSPMTLVQSELEDLFSSMGFVVLDGPELESDYYNFASLNIPKTHPARDMQDTFYIDKKNSAGEYDLVMRTHTSPVQARALQKYGAPLRAVAPGRVFRNEAIDACHEHTFNQMEGLMVDENISLAHLIAVMKNLINGIFKREVETRIRPGYFPFVEPGIEMDIKCTICCGDGCPSCKNSGWLELLPAGLVHPNVLKASGVDPEKYSGFAFGLGLTRLVMMRHGVEDIRLFNSGDLRFFKQF